jgi:chitinase
MLPEPRSINLIVSSPGHFGFVTNAAARAIFVSNAVKMIEDYGFDGM